jgi:copper oxidase (laccase) domain-containing protein
MAQRFGAILERSVAGICPSAGPCCYRVGAEVRKAAIAALGPEAAEWFDDRGADLHFDLWRANTRQLERSGVRSDAIHVAGTCTICRNDLFPSYRAEGRAADRFAAAIAIR